MAPFPDNVTVKIMLDYTVGDDAHVMLMRAAPGFSELGWLTARDNLYTVLLDNSSNNTNYIAERIQFPGQAFSLPYRTIGRVGQFAGTLTGDDQPFQVTWQGRDSQGRRGRLSVFGIATAQQTNNWRLEASEETFVDGVRSILQAVPAEFVTITGEQASWLPYASVTYNRRQIRRQRA